MSRLSVSRDTCCFCSGWLVSAKVPLAEAGAQNLENHKISYTINCLYLNRVENCSLGIIDASKWDGALQQVKRGCTNKLKQSATEINADLQRYGAEMQMISKEF